MRSLRSAGSVRLPCWYSPRAFCVCVHSRSRGVRAPPPPWLMWRGRALVGPFHAVRAPPRVLPRSRAPFGLLGRGGRPGPVSPLPGWGLCAPFGSGLRVAGVPAPGVGGGGGACVSFSPSVRPGGPVGRGAVLPQPVPLPSLGRQQSGCPRRRSRHGGRGPHTAPVGVLLLSLGAVRVAPLCASAGSLAHRGSCESRRQVRGGAPCCDLPPRRRGPAEGMGDHLPASGGRGAGAPVARGPVGGWGDGGGSHAVAPHLPPLGGAVCGFLPCSPFVAGASPPLSVGVVGQPLAPGAVCCRRASLAEGGGWVGLGQGLIRTSGTADVALPCASQLVRWVLGCPVSRPTGLMSAPVPRGGTRGREMPPYLCVWGARAAGGCGAWTGWAARHVGSHGSAAPGPAPDQSVTQGGVPGLGSTPCSGLWGGGGL